MNTLELNQSKYLCPKGLTPFLEYPVQDGGDDFHMELYCPDCKYLTDSPIMCDECGYYYSEEHYDHEDCENGDYQYFSKLESDAENQMEMERGN